MPVYGHQHSISGPGRFHPGSFTPADDPFKANTQTSGASRALDHEFRSPASSAAVNSSYSAAGSTIPSSFLTTHSRPVRSESSPSGLPMVQVERHGEELLGSNNYNQPAHPSYSPSGSSFRNDRNMSASGGMSLPGALQPGRPNAVSTNTAPSSVPSLPPISTSSQSQQFSSPSRASTASHSHSYSHSSPAPAYSEDAHKYASTPTHKYMQAQTPQTSTYSPLGLADIRPRADSGNEDALASANPYQEMQGDPTNCNYLAPWAVYSFDWCKWPVHQQGLGDAAGKMAIGSYLEDGHNYVRLKSS